MFTNFPKSAPPGLMFIRQLVKGEVDGSWMVPFPEHSTSPRIGNTQFVRDGKQIQIEVVVATTFGVPISRYSLSK